MGKPSNGSGIKLLEGHTPLLCLAFGSGEKDQPARQGAHVDQSPTSPHLQALVNLQRPRGKLFLIRLIICNVVVVHHDVSQVPELEIVSEGGREIRKISTG